MRNNVSDASRNLRAAGDIRAGFGQRLADLIRIDIDQPDELQTLVRQHRFSGADPDRPKTDDDDTNHESEPFCYPRRK